ncbi:hypothetical protein A1O7_08544 [Cladophialophora yegresii CBS 114405]|uniref:BZIP domain-containing protein n=1 Tax=Cladophialophora yegresii CBS 114405 TaxID=1182544 RepID=W9VRH1_9EURO|nr:uncharacterized protein A1O7_08544 [Cladophialophora yegresii CBS 114405]EXJ55615.1 hypothetical protein A1O7_08544 [Cladophialophora yegresii CBS 114405]
MDPASSSSTFFFGKRVRTEAAIHPYVYLDTHHGRFEDDEEPALRDCEWDQLLATYSLTLATSPFAASTPTGSCQDQSENEILPAGAFSGMLNESHFLVIDPDGRGCEVVQSRCERRRAQNRKAQRAYRARKEAQLETASSTLAEKQSQLRTLHLHNQELLGVIDQLKAVIVQLEAENQLLKERQCADGGLSVEASECMTENASFVSALAETTVLSQKNRLEDGKQL